MTSRARPLAAAALALALATGCPLDLAQYEPKVDADCDYGMKACGYRCVPNDNPATGCWEVENVCDPCPTGAAHTVPACESATMGWPVCTTICEVGWGDCDGNAANGCETDLSATDAHCGACWHACAGTDACAAGVCPAAQFGVTLPEAPVDIDKVGTTILAVDAGGALRNTASPVAPIVSGLGAVRRLRMVSSTLGWVTGTETIDTTTYGTLWKIVNSGTFSKTSWANTTGTITDFALLHDDAGTIVQAAWAPSDATGYRLVDVANSAATATRDRSYYFTALAADPTVPPFYELYAGSADGFLTDWVPSGGGGFGGVAPPTRLEAFKDLADDVTLFSASASDGSVTVARGSSVDRIIAGAGPTIAIDIHADADGVYWCDATAGVVRAWRALDGFVFDLARGGHPVAVTSDGTTVYWADAADNTIRSVVK